jgi:hypothetical protein
VRRLIFCTPAMARVARYTSVVCLVVQMFHVLDRSPVSDPTAKRILPLCAAFLFRALALPSTHV